MDLLDIVNALWICTRKLDIACKAVGNVNAFPGNENISSFLNDIYDEYCHILDEINIYQISHKNEIDENEDEIKKRIKIMTRLDFLKAYLIDQIAQMSVGDMFAALRTHDFEMTFDIDVDVYDTDEVERRLDLDNNYRQNANNKNYDMWDDSFRLFKEIMSGSV